MDGDEKKEQKKRRSLQAGRAVLARYKASQELSEMNQTDSSDIEDPSIHNNNNNNESLDHQSVSMTEDISYRDTTQSSMSASEGEGDADFEKITARIAKLQERVAGKEAVIESLGTEIKNITNNNNDDDESSPNSSQSCNSSIQNKDLIQVYKSKFHDFEEAILVRDHFIQTLSSSLQQAIEERDVVKVQLEELNAIPVDENNPAAKKINYLQQLLTEEKKKSQEFEYKLRETQEQLNSNIEDTRKTSEEYQAQVNKINLDMDVVLQKFQDQTELNEKKHKDEINKLAIKHQDDLTEINQKHAKELNAFQLQASSYKKTIEMLKLELEAKSDTEVIKLKNSLIKCQEDKELLHQQINLHKEQINELTAKCVATTSVFESKESIERSMEEASSLKEENEKLKSKYDELSAKYSAIRALIDNNQLNDRSLNVDKSLGKMSGINASFMSEFNSTIYQNIDEMAVQIQTSRAKLEEKEALENKLIEKIKHLEDNIFTRDEQLDKLNKKLEESNMEKKSYEKQLKDMKNKCDKLMSDIENSSNKIDNELSEKLISNSKEIQELYKLLEEKDNKISENESNLKSALEKINKYESKCDQLQNGLQQAYKQCSDQERKLDQSLSMNQSQFTIHNDTTNPSAFFHIDHSLDMTAATDNNPSFRVSKFFANDSSCIASEDINDTERQKKLEKIEEENQRLLDENTGLLKTLENLEILKQSIDIVNNEKALLHQEITELNKKHQDECLKLKEKYDELESLLAGSGIDKYKADMEKQHHKEMDELRKFFEGKCREMEKQYSDEVFNQQSKKMSDDSSEIDDLTDDLYFGGGDSVNNLERTNKSTSLTIRETIDKNCQTELEAPVENGELTDLRTYYQQQVLEQLHLAKQDFVNELEKQIQVLLEDESDSEENWPTELLQLRNKFTSKSNREMENLKEIHGLEIMKIKEDHSRAMSRLMERYEEEIRKSNEKNDKSFDADSVLMKEKNLYKTCVTLKSLVIDLFKYFVTCEEELNNTFLVEIIKRQVSLETQTNSDIDQDSEDALEKNKNPDQQDSDSTSPKTKIKRVHFAPKMNKISTIVNSEIDILLQLVEEEHDISIKLREELDKCLERMKIESAELINISLPPGETMLETIAKQLRWTTKVNEELSLKLQETENIIQDYQNESQQLKLTIKNLQHKLIIDASNEIISEGYGEKDDTATDIVEEDFTELHEKARLAIISGSEDSTHLLQLIEELCRYNEKIAEDFKKDREDLQQQVVAADNKLRSTLEFLEGQACEREAERDDAAQKIKYLEKQLKERERDKERDLRISSEPASPSPDSSAATCHSPATSITPEIVESMETQIREMTQLLSSAELKKSEAENDLEEAVKKIYDLRDIIRKLEDQVSLKDREEESLTNKVEDLKEIIESMTQQQQVLVEELEAIRTNGDSQLNNHLTHLEEELRKHKLSTEHFNVNSTALKQMKSELREMSDHLDKRIAELEALHMCGSNLSISQPSEDVSIRDQIDASRSETPEDDPASPPTLPLDKILKLKEKLQKHSRTEQVAFKKIQDLDTQLKNLKIQNEELIAQQETLQEVNSDQLFTIEQMRGRLEEYKHSAPYAQRQATSKLEHELHDLNGKLQTMEQHILSRDLEIKNLKQQLAREKILIYEKQQEYESAVQNENLTHQQLRNKLKVLEDEKNDLEKKLLEQRDCSELINSMLTDKNDEIDHLKDQLKKKDKIIESLDESNARQNEQKNSARTLSDIVSINSECEEICEAIRAESTNIHHNFTRNLSMPVNNNNNNNQGKDTLDSSSVFGKSELRIPLLDLGQSHSPNNTKQVSLESSDVHVPSPPSSESTSNHEKSNVKNSSPTLNINNSNNKQQAIEELENQLKAIYEELKIKSSELDKREIELNELKYCLNELRAESKHSIDTLTSEKIFYKTQYESSQETENKIRKDLEEIENILKIKTEESDNYKEKIKINEKHLNELKTDNKNLKDDIDKLRENNLQELSKLDDIIFNKDIIIETIKTRNIEIENENKQLYDFKTKYEKCRKELIDCQRELKRLSEESSGKNSESDDNNNKDQEIHHLKEYLKEKEKIIREMSEDSKSLQRSLETIQNKMKESGNVIELRKKLNQERKYNTEYARMIATLTRELESLRDESSRQINEVNDIEDRVQRELNLSADLDKSILEAIESENAEMSMNRMEIQSCTSLEIKPVKQDLEKIMEQYQDIRTKLDQQIKINQQLKREKEDLEIHQEFLKSQVTEYEDRILQIKKSYENEVKKNSELNTNLSSQKATRRNLEIQFRKDKSALLKTQSEDAEIIELLRIKYSASLKAEDKLKETLTDLREKYEMAISQLNNLKKQIDSNNKIEQKPNSSVQLLEAEQSSSSSSSSSSVQNKYIEKYEKEYRENIELKETVEKITLEKDRCIKNLEIAVEENEKLLSTVALLEDTKAHVEIELKHTNDELKLKTEECEWLQKRIKTMTDAETKRAEKKTDYEDELKKLKREMINMKEVMSDADADANEMRRQLTLSLSEQAQLSQVVMSLRKIEADLKKKLNDAMLEEGKLRVIITDLQSQLRSVQRDYLATKDLGSGEKEKESHYEKIIHDLNNEIDRYSHEKLILHEKLTKAREDNARLELKNRDLIEAPRSRYETCSSSDAVKKLQHMYGKFMRADSKRKALAFQKRYLLCVIGGYQLSEETTLGVLAQLTNEQKSFMITDNNERKAKIRFRCLVIGIISIHRMKWKVQRWRKGIRKSSTEIQNREQHQNERTVFMPIGRTYQEHSPPVRDKRTSNSTGGGGGAGLDYQHYIQRMLSIKDAINFASGESASRE